MKVDVPYLVKLKSEIQHKTNATLNLCVDFKEARKVLCGNAISIIQCPLSKMSLFCKDFITFATRFFEKHRMACGELSAIEEVDCVFVDPNYDAEYVNWLGKFGEDADSYYKSCIESAISKVIESNERFQRNKKCIILTYLGNDAIEEIRSKFSGKTIFIPYTKEKKLADEFASFETLVDIRFDVSLETGGYDISAVLRYLAANHRHKLREFLEVRPELVNSYMTNRDLKDYRVL